jgi:O-antigen ligase
VIEAQRTLDAIGARAGRQFARPLAAPNRRMAVRRAAAPLIGMLVAVASGAAIAHGAALYVLLMLAGTAFVLWAISYPEHAALGLVAITPFSIYPATVGGFSVFLVVPLLSAVSVLLLLRRRGVLTRLRGRLPVATFALLLAAAAVTTLVSTAPTAAGSRLLYLAVFGLFAAALASSMREGRLSDWAIAQAVVFAAATAGIALIIQVLAQFSVGKVGVTNWLVGELRLFGGAHAAGELGQLNWTVDGLGVVRGIFPFMDAPGAGQFMMLGLVAAVWMRIDPRSGWTWIQRRAGVAAIVLIAAGLLMTFSRQSWVGAFVGLGALALRRRPLPMLLAILVLFVVMTAVPAPGTHQSFADYLLSAQNTSSTSTATRLDLWRQALQLLPGHLAVGVGPGLYATLNPDPTNPIYYAHNVFLDELVELGAVGGLALIVLLVRTMSSAFRRAATLSFAMLSAWVAANLFDDALYEPRNLMLLAVAFALAAADPPARPAGLRTTRELRAPRESATPGATPSALLASGRHAG